MHIAVLAALRAFFGWLLSGTVLKAVVLTAIAGVIMFMAEWLWSLLPDYFQPSTLTAALITLPPGVWWVLDYFRVGYGFPLLLSAAVVAFLIRRLPVVG